MKRLILLVVLLASCSTFGPPYFKPVEQKNTDPRFSIHIDKIGYVGPVKDKWWGERFFRVIVTVKNTSNKYAYLKMYRVKLEKRNFDYVMQRNRVYGILYEKNPETFDLPSFFDENAGLDLQVQIDNPAMYPTDKYNGKDVFPRQTVDGKELFSAAMISGYYGSPMVSPVHPTDNSTGWIGPGISRTITLHYSVPAGGKIVRIVMPGKYESLLTETDKAE